MLFDDIEQHGFDHESPPKSSFRYLNESDSPDATRKRKCLESWFNRIPSAAQSDIRSRLRSDDDNVHEEAFFELYVHELLIRVGCTLSVHPQTDGSDTRPDFLVRHGAHRFYLEATVVGRRAGPFTRSRNEQDVINKLNTLNSANFSIGVDMEGTLSRTLGLEQVTRPFKELLNAHEPDEVQRLIDEGGLHYAPSRSIECGDWALTGWLKPISSENRRRGIAPQQIVIEPYQVKWSDSATPVRKALIRKARKYGDLSAPLVVAVNIRDAYYAGQISDLEVLLGDEQILSSHGHSELTPRTHYRGNGVWGRTSKIDAVLRFHKVDAWNLTNASVCLYSNPRYKAGSLPDPLFRLPYAKAHHGEVRWFGGESPAQLVGWT